MACQCVCMWMISWIHTYVCSCSCMYIKCVPEWLCYLSPCPLPRPSIPACQWCGPLIGGPGLSRHGNCTKANKGVEQSRGNTVTQRGYLARWKVSGEAHTKAKPPLDSRGDVALLCVSLRMPHRSTQFAEMCGLLLCRFQMNSLSLSS